VVEYSYGENDLFMNYQIARAFTDRLTFPAIQKVGHPVLQWSGSGPRMGLFSMNKTSVGAIAKITSAFESVGGGADANKVLPTHLKVVRSDQMTFHLGPT